MTFNCGAFFAAPVTAAVFEAACARQSISRNISSMCVCILVGLNGTNSMFGVSRQQRNFKMITKHRVQHAIGNSGGGDGGNHSFLLSKCISIYRLRLPK